MASARRTVTWVLVEMVLLASGCGGCGRKPASSENPPEVRVVAVAQDDVPIHREWITTLEGFVHAHVHPQISGYLLSRDYREGSLVKKGALMFTIDPRTVQAALDQALAKLGKDELDIKRLAPLVEHHAATQEELDNANQAYLGDKAIVDQARVNLQFTRVTSPIDGLAGLADAEIGDLVGPDTTELTTVSAIDPIKAYFTVSEDQYLSYMRQFLGAALTNQEAQLELFLGDGSQYPLKGTIYSSDNQMDPRTGALRIAAVFPNPDHDLLPGQFGRVRITQILRDALVIPQRAVIEMQGTAHVNVIGSDNKVRSRPVDVGERTDSMWIIRSGMKKGEFVVVEGNQKVNDGQTVHPVPFEPPASESAAVKPTPGAR
jgi:RND family efflux transporter MFP subunit